MKHIIKIVLLMLVVAACNKSKNEREVVINTVEQYQVSSGTDSFVQLISEESVRIQKGKRFKHEYAFGMVHPDKDWVPDFISLRVTVRSKGDDGNFIFKEEIYNQSKKEHNIDIKIK